MTAKKIAVPPDRAVTLQPADSAGAVQALYVWKRYRFLFGDGRTLDVVAIQDDSDLRAAVLEHMRAAKIAGVAVIAPKEGGDVQVD